MHICLYDDSYASCASDRHQEDRVSNSGLLGLGCGFCRFQSRWSAPEQLHPKQTELPEIDRFGAKLQSREHKRNEVNPQPSILNPQSSTLNPHLSTLDSQHPSLIPHSPLIPKTLNHTIPNQTQVLREFLMDARDACLPVVFKIGGPNGISYDRIDPSMIFMPLMCYFQAQVLYPIHRWLCNISNRPFLDFFPALVFHHIHEWLQNE